MFFVLSRFAGFLGAPSNVLLLTGLLGVVLLALRRAKWGRRLIVTSVVLLLLAAYGPFGPALLLPLEQRFPPWTGGSEAPYGIIVLGGMIDPEISQARGQAAFGDAAERLTMLADLARRFPAARIVISSGNAALFPSAPPEAQLAVPVTQSFGIDRARIALEDRSRSTAENASFTAALVGAERMRRWLLVTSAFHMPRAMGAFRKAGFNVEAFPVDWRTTGPQAIWNDNWGLGRLGFLDLATHEWIGLVAYWATGRSSELFPGP